MGALLLACERYPAFGEPDSAPPGRLRIGDLPNYPASPYHGARDGDGRTIPCRCRFGGRDYRLGEVVCMATHVGTVLTRCDLLLNNTSWMPTATPCEVSLIPLDPGRRYSAIARR